MDAVDVAVSLEIDWLFLLSVFVTARIFRMNQISLTTRIPIAQRPLLIFLWFYYIERACRSSHVFFRKTLVKCATILAQSLDVSKLDSWKYLSLI